MSPLQPASLLPLSLFPQHLTEELLNKGREGIKAEFDGIIANVQAVEGSSAVQGGELFTLVSSKDVYSKVLSAFVASSARFLTSSFFVSSASGARLASSLSARAVSQIL